MGTKIKEDKIELRDIRKVLSDSKPKDIMLLVKADRKKGEAEASGMEVYTRVMDRDDWLDVWFAIFSMCREDETAWTAMLDVIDDMADMEENYEDIDGDDDCRDAKEKDPRVEVAMMFASKEKGNVVN